MYVLDKIIEKTERSSVDWRQGASGTREFPLKDYHKKDYRLVSASELAAEIRSLELDGLLHLSLIHIFSLKHDPRANVSMLDTALINTRKLNKALQDMLHNMDKFFGSLLEQRAYGELLRDHLEGYVEEVVRRKYHILKTSDNFYIYKADIKRWIGQMREDGEWLETLCARSLRGQGTTHMAAAPTRCV